MIIFFKFKNPFHIYFLFAGLPPAPAPPLAATTTAAPTVDNNLIALLQSGGLLNFPPHGELKMQKKIATPVVQFHEIFCNKNNENTLIYYYCC